MVKATYPKNLISTALEVFEEHNKKMCFILLEDIDVDGNSRKSVNILIPKNERGNRDP